MEGEQETVTESTHMTTMKTTGSLETVHFMVLRTVPIVDRSGSCQLVINALLNDASTNTYINSDMASELRVQCFC